jgi:hypothetical protein
MNKFWNAAVAVCGFSAVAAFVFWSLYNQWLSLPIFEKLNQQQTFVIMLVFLCLTFAALTLMLVVYLKQPQTALHAEDNSLRARFLVADAIDEFFATFYSAAHQVTGISPEEIRKQPQKIDPHLEEIEAAIIGTKVMDRLSTSIDTLSSNGFNGLSRSSGIVTTLQSIRAQILLGSSDSRYAMLGVIAAINGKDLQNELRRT